MFWESRRDQWLLIGTQVGMGYDCLMDKIDLFEDRALNEGFRRFHNHSEVHYYGLLWSKAPTRAFTFKSVMIFRKASRFHI